MNSQAIALIQTLLRLIGPDSTNYYHNLINYHQNNKNQSIYAIFEDMLTRSKGVGSPLSGPDIAKLMKIGTRVVRGADWKWGDQVSEFTLKQVLLQSYTNLYRMVTAREG